jgi:hypothetical protein
MAGRKKTKSWLQLSPDWKTPRTFPGLENAEDFTRLLALGEGKIVFGFF